MSGNVIVPGFTRTFLKVWWRGITSSMFDCRLQSLCPRCALMHQNWFTSFFSRLTENMIQRASELSLFIFFSGALSCEITTTCQIRVSIQLTTRNTAFELPHPSEFDARRGWLPCECSLRNVTSKVLKELKCHYKKVPCRKSVSSVSKSKYTQRSVITKRS